MARKSRYLGYAKGVLKIGNDKSFPKEQWDEKITDSINYLLILRAIVEEETHEED